MVLDIQPEQRIRKMRRYLLATALCLAASPALAADGVPDSLIARLRADLEQPITVIMLRAQNQQHASLAQEQIDALDQTWRAEAEADEQPLIAQLMGNPMTSYVTRLAARSGGLYSEIFVMDAKGLNVGQSSVTSDYWQGDEAKWQKTYGAGAGVVFVDEVEEDESTQALQSQASVTISDPETGEPIGAITIGINLDML